MQPKIMQILNNNVVVVLDEKASETIVMGRGLAFQKKPGDLIDTGRIEKTFTLKDKDTNSRFQDLVKEIPIEHFLVSEKIIKYAKASLGKKLSDSIYVTLTDHISTAVTRFRNGITFSNPFLWDIKQFYPDEMKAARESVQMINQCCATELSEDEASFIAMHFVNAQLDESIPFVGDMTKLMQSITNIVQYYLQFDFETESLAYYRFITHLKFFAQSVLKKTVRHDDGMGDILNDITSKYPKAYACALKVSDFMCKQYDYDMTDDEALYMTIHIERIYRAGRKQ